MGGIAGYYGNAWTLPRVGVTAVGGGLASEVSGGSFRQGALFSGGMALATYAAIKMNNYEWRHSPRQNQGRERASDLFEGSVAGGRDERTWDPKAKAYVFEPNDLPLGGIQGSATPKFISMSLDIKSVGNFLLELGGGPHDFFSHPFAYDALGFNNARESLFGRIIAGIAGNAAADRFSDLVAGVALVPTIPVTGAALVGLSPSTTSLVIQKEAQ